MHNILHVCQTWFSCIISLVTDTGAFTRRIHDGLGWAFFGITPESLAPTEDEGARDEPHATALLETADDEDAPADTPAPHSPNMFRSAWSSLTDRFGPTARAAHSPNLVAAAPPTPPQPTTPTLAALPNSAATDEDDPPHAGGRSHSDYDDGINVFEEDLQGYVAQEPEQLAPESHWSNSTVRRVCRVRLRRCVVCACVGCVCGGAGVGEMAY
jgi:hypothetical protein